MKIPALTNRIPLFISGVIVVYLLFSLPLVLKWPPPMIDEARFASTAKTLLDDGHLGTPLVRGLESRAYWQPPAYFLALAPVISIGGYSIVTLRIFSLLVGAAIILLVYHCSRWLSGKPAAIVASIFLTCDPHFVNNVKFVRMDGLCVLFILLALAALVKPMHRNSTLNTLLAGVFVALASLTHPFGIVAAAAMALYVIVRREPPGHPLNLGLFLLPLLAGLAIWGNYVARDFPAFILQMKYQLGRKDRPLALTLVNAFSRYRYAPLSLALPLAGWVFIVVRALRSRGNELLFALTITGTMAIVLSKFEIPYHVYIAPLGAMTAGTLFVELWNGGSPVKHWISLCTGVLFILNAILVFGFLNLILHAQPASRSGYYEFCEDVSSYLPRRVSMCGWGSPCLYWGLNTARPDVRFVDRAFLDSVKADEVINNIDYVVLSRAYSPEEDEVGLMQQRHDFSALCKRNHRELRPLAFVGTRERYAYSAELYQILPADGK